MVFQCDEEWKALGVAGGHATLAEAKADTERAYRGVGALWIDTGTSVAEARKWLEERFPADLCSFCDRMPFEFENWFYGHRATICGDCVRQYFAMLPTPPEPDDEDS